MDSIKKGRLLVRGSINIDEFFQVPHIVTSGETIASTGFSKRGGGKGSNQAVAAAKARGSVEFAGHIGSDGEWLKDTLVSHGVGVEHLLTDPSLPTGRAIIQLSTSTSDNSIVLLPGANHSTLPFSASISTPSNLSSFSFLLLQNEIPLSSTRHFLSLAHSVGCSTIFNPSPLLSPSEIESFEWDKVNWLIVNQGEGKALLEVLAPRRDHEEIPELDEMEVIVQLQRVFPKTEIVLTCGAQGVLACSTDRGEIITLPAGRVVGKVADTTGAGDTFTGYLAALLAAFPPSDTAELESILRVCSQASAICVESAGAAESVPTINDVRKRMGQSWEKKFDTLL